MYKENFGHSQNFLSDPFVVKRLVNKADIQPVDLVIDIGAGTGVITRELISRTSNVVALEIDPKLFAKIPSVNNLIKYNIDFLSFSLPKNNYKVLSNIPFNHSSRILKKLYLSEENSPSISYLILQKEVYEKYSGKCKETQLSLLLKPFYEFKFVQNISTSCFTPKPAVDIVFVSIFKRDFLLVGALNITEYRDFVTFGTSIWRKDIKNIFKNVFTYPQLKKLSKDFKFSLKANPLDLNFNQWLGLFNFYLYHVDLKKKSLIKESYQKKLVAENNLNKVYRTNTY